MLPRLKRFRKRSRHNNILTFILPGLFVIVFLALLAVSNWKIYVKRTVMEEQINALQGEAGELEKRNQKLQSDISQTQTQEYLEEVARERLNLKKPGEEVVAVVIPESNGEESAQDNEKSWWEKILEKMGL